MMKHLARLALMAALLPTYAIAADTEAEIPTLKICDLISNADLAAWYPEETSKPEAQSQIMKKGTSGAPANFRASTCFRPSTETPVRGASFIVVESFDPKVATKDVAEWLAKNEASDQPESGYTDIKRIKLGNATCESGNYALPQVEHASSDEKEETFSYVACDELFNNHHVVINLQWPANNTHLPTLEQTKALLDLAEKRLPVTAKR